jgi:hypothetical protein
MPRPRKLLKTQVPSMTIELPESVLAAALRQALEPVYQELHTLTQENLEFQQQLANCLEVQMTLVAPLPQFLGQIATQQTQLHQTLTELLRQLESNSTQNDLAKQLEQLTLSFTRLSIQLTHSISLQQQISASLASLNQQPEDDLGF